MNNPEYAEDVNTYIGELIRTEKLETGEVIIYIYQCEACDGSGGADWSKDCEVYDDWHSCEVCEGTGEIEVEA